MSEQHPQSSENPGDDASSSSPAESKNGLATAALVLGIFAFFTVGISGLVGAPLGHVALRSSRQLNGKGRGRAIAGFTCSYVAIGLWALLLVLGITSGGDEDNAEQGANIPATASPGAASDSSPVPQLDIDPFPSADATSAPEDTGESPSAGSESMGPAEVYEMVSPSVPLIETSFGTGSGMLIEGGYVVTNHHVVWPEEAVWVVFPDGTEFEGVPVLAFDYIADLAVLGPVAHDAAPLRLAGGEDMAPGSELFLIGYPAEYEEYPDPTITQGILSRVRQWDTYDLTLLQTDAAISGGQSGGALVNDRGEVVGISTWGFSEAGFGVATSAADAEAIVSELIEDYEASGYQSGRRVSNEAGKYFYLVTDLIAQAFTFEGAAGTIVTITIEGEEDGIIRISNATGIVLEVDATVTGEEIATFELVQDGLYFVEVDTYDQRIYQFELASSIRLLPYGDPDDGQLLAENTDIDLVYGFIDFYSDIDWYTIELDAGETILAYTDSITADTAVAIWNPQTDELFSDDDSGPASVFGQAHNAQLQFTAPTDGDRYHILVEDVLGERGNGYVLIVERLG